MQANSLEVDDSASKSWWRTSSLSTNQCTARLQVMWIMKKRNPATTFCELFSHLILLSLLVAGYFLAKISRRSANTYSHFSASIPLANSQDPSSLDSIMDALKGPLIVPDIDQYIRLGDYLANRFADDRKSLKQTALGSSLISLITHKPLYFAPNSIEVMNLVHHLNTTYQYFYETDWRVFETEEDAVNEALLRGQLFALIVLNEVSDKTVNYKIRLRPSVVPNTNTIASTPSVGFNVDYWRYFFNGYFTLRKAVDNWAFSFSNASSPERFPFDLDPALSPIFEQQCQGGAPDPVFTAFPTFAYSLNPFYASVGFLLGLAMIMSTMYPMSKLAKSIVEEKELKLRELMKIMGLKDYIHRLSWFLSSFLLFLWVAVSSTVVITASFVRTSDGLIIFVFYFLFCLTEISLAMLVSVFFSNSKLAAIAAPVALFAFSLPRFVYYSVDPTEEVPSKIATCLLSPAGFAYGADLIAQFEYAGVGIQWYNLFQGPFSFGIICIMLFFDFFIYGFLAWYLDQVLPQEFGTSKHPLFLFFPSYWKWLLSTKGSRETLMFDCMDDFEPPQPLQVDDTDFNDRIEMISPELQELGKVRIKHLGKTFGDGKVAVRDLSLSLLEGQITCLLGHNGAGKSTAIATLTGLLQATKGDVSIYGYLLSQDLQAIRQLTGLCPQQNVLFPMLTVKEHLTFFGKLKGLFGQKLKDQVDGMIDEVGLTEKRHVQSSALSGGMKRKLCLAMALMGDPKFVLLDEPTSGMDPYSRRATWELLQKHKAGRVVMLTTHFMDEADTLADRIAIMSEGLLLCSGSSLFLKRRFGAGYLLTCCKVSVDTPIDALDVEVKTIIPLATTVSAVAGEVVYGLPLISTHSFHILFASLESNKERLGLKSFGVSVTSLEQVFLSLARCKDQSEHSLDNRNPILCDCILRWLCLSNDHRKSAKGRNNVEETWFNCLHRCYSNERAYSDYDVETGMEMKDLAGEQGGMEAGGNTLAPPLPLDVFVAPLEARDVTTTHRPGSIHISPLLLQSNAFEVASAASHRKSDGIAKVRPCTQLYHLLAKRSLVASRDLKGVFFQVIFPALQVLLILLLLGISPKPRGRSIVMNGDLFKTYGGIDASLVVANANSTIGLEGKYTVGSAPSTVHDSTSLSLWLLNKTHFEDSRYGAYVFNDSIPVSLTVDWSWLSGHLGDGALPFFLNGSWSTDDSVLTENHNHRHAGNVSKRQGPFGTSPSLPGLEFLYLQYLLSGGTGTGKYNFTVQRPYTVMHNTTSPHAAAAWHGELVAEAFQTCTRNPTASYTVQNHPIPQTRSTVLKNRVFLSLLTSIFILVPLSQSPASYVAFVVKERVTKCTHVQIASGISPSIYWLSTYLWDMISFVVLALCVLIAFFVVGESNAAVFVGTSETSTCVLLLILSYGASAIPVNYIYSFAFENFSTAQITVMLINFMTGFVLVLAHYVMQVTPELEATARVLVHVFRFFPGYLLGEALINLTTVYLQNTLRGQHIGVFDWTVTGRSLTFMLLEAVGYMGLVLLSESALVKELSARRHLGQAMLYLPCPPPKRDPDDDVIEEDKHVQSYLAALHALQHSQRQSFASSSYPVAFNPAVSIDTAATNASRQQHFHNCRSKVKQLALLISDLVKVYVPLHGSRPKYAVRGLSLACMEGERFGLLGINGAGKTTTLSVLTGESVASSGEIFIGNEPLSNSMTQRMLGYCPQVDPLLELMTAYETLFFFGRIRGLKESVLQQRVHTLVRQTGLLPHAHRPCGTYSGGNKRKLSLAVALIG